MTGPSVDAVRQALAAHVDNHVAHDEARVQAAREHYEAADQLAAAEDAEASAGGWGEG